MSSNSENLILEQVTQAVADRKPLSIIGGNSKSFYGRIAKGDPLEINHHQGVVSYEPSELVLTAKAGTKITEIQSLLASNNQMLGFEPPYCNEDSTLGGVIACGLSGCVRPWSGSARDFVLGVKMINGLGQILSFGGQVMKNVAGFDHSRLMTGSLGTLGVIMEVSIRVVPVPKFEQTCEFDHDDLDIAIAFINQLAAKPYSLSAAAWIEGKTQIRLSGTQQGVQSAHKDIGGRIVDHAEQYWNGLNQHELSAFKTARSIFKVSLPGAVKNIFPSEYQIVDWGGAQRWLFDLEDSSKFSHLANENGGSLMHFKGGDPDQEVFEKLDEVTFRIHQNLKLAFDPHQIFNIGRMYKQL